MNRVGFRGFTKPAVIDPNALALKLTAMSLSNLYVMWTGNAYRARRMSARSNALATVTEKMVPVSLEELLKRAAVAKGDEGYTPELVRAGLFLHQGAKPATYLALERREDGAFVAAKAIPVPDPAFYSVPFAAGAVVIEAPGAAQAQIEGPKDEPAAEPKALPMSRKAKKAAAAAAKAAK